MATDLEVGGSNPGEYRMRLQKGRKLLLSKVSAKWKWSGKFLSRGYQGWLIRN